MLQAWSYGTLAHEAANGSLCPAATLGPTPYLNSADSPFASGSFGYFHLETFEYHLLNSPEVSANAGGVTSVVFGPFIHGSVDADDGVRTGRWALLANRWKPRRPAQAY